MKQWKIYYALGIGCEVVEEFIILNANTIHEALHKAEAEVHLAADASDADKYMIWDIGIMDDELF
jgi:hypothetical protein